MTDTTDTAAAATGPTLADVKAEADATAAELAAHEAADKATPKPSLGRIVIVHSEHRPDAPGIITAVHEDGSIDVQVFRGDHVPHAEHHLVDGDASGAVPHRGYWSWPARV